MNELMQLAAVEIAKFLAKHLPSFSTNWWKLRVIDRLTFSQQRTARERNFSSLEQLDFAALLRTFDQNWNDLSYPLSLAREGRSWIKELQEVRNKWAHLSVQAMPPSEIYRDADTIGRVLEMLSADHKTLESVEMFKESLLASMAHSKGIPFKSGTLDTKLNNEPSAVVPGPEVISDRLYAFNVGDLVSLRSDPGTVVPIIEIIPGDAENRFKVFQNGKKIIYYESQLESLSTDEDKNEYLEAKELQAYITSLQILSPSTSNLFSLRSGRVKFVPYQYRPVLKLIRADRPRLLIADEVGVGKTIEAGLIIKELRARMDITSVLIICPKALVAERKWFVEMKRFDEHFTPLDGQLLRHCMKETHLDGEWPEQYSKAILPFSLFDSELIFGENGRGAKRKEGLLGLNPPPKFDLVIVDEAHHIRNPETYLHQGVRYFCDNAQAVIFLTATPVQLGSEDLFTLLNVLRPDIVIDKASFAQMAEPNRFINSAVQHCRAAQENWQEDARANLNDAAQTQWGQLYLRETPSFQSVYDQLAEPTIDSATRVRLTRSLEELYTFSSMINRTRRRDIGEFTTRKPETLTIDFTPTQQCLHDKLLELVARILAFTHGQQSVKFMMTTIRRQAASCIYGLAPLLRNILVGKLDSLELMEAGDTDIEASFGFVESIRGEIEELLKQAELLEIEDPKIEELLKVFRDKITMPNNKALLFSTFRHTLAYISGYLEEAGFRFGLVHGDIVDEERADLRRRFALPKEDSNALDILLSSEVGCEGLDFQFCDLLVNYDLPWNPMRIEQRIGRIDRYGQKSETVAIKNLITPGTVDADIYDRCLWRIGVFQHAVGGSEEILGEITKEIHNISESYNLSEDERNKRLKQLGDNSIRIIQEEQALEEKQAEMFGLTIPKQSWRQEIDDAETVWLSSTSLQKCVSVYLANRLKVEGQYFLGEKPLKTLRLNHEARSILLEDYYKESRPRDQTNRQWEKWLKGDDPMLPITFDQETAMENPDVVHLGVLHPLIKQAAKHLGRSDSVCVNLEVFSNDVTPGIYHFVIYRWNIVGVKPDEKLIAVTTSPDLDEKLMSLLYRCSNSMTVDNVNTNLLSELEHRHYIVWNKARFSHISENKELLQHRIQSLTISNQARCRAIEDQIDRISNERIRRMKEAELVRAKLDFERRLDELEKAERGADIHSSPVISGSLSVARRV
ncbi:Helicase conserved C-terminal domain-containing protein [Desulfomicrobium apsheronum]|uniref:Helicase conserved C-terminal domain-containing protein n=1 Tax=Desulfomicrobium apsheronum TaxID=52560 RepID=A0A1I3X5M9_9BACT|nr:SNF2-related protein [Desulfomicrobium apsheronum]SFK15142.1 Helicase conserved C-terminal domain-containing protein [Desulfomicrobium apsheronum]